MKKYLRRGILVIIISAALVGVFIWDKYGNLSIPLKEMGNTTMTTDGRFTYPAGFTFTEFATGIKGARTIIQDPRGRLLIVQMSEGKISVLEDTNKDGKADNVTALVVGLKLPHGMAFRCGHEKDYVVKSECVLYVATQEELLMYPYFPETATVGKQEPQLELPGGSLGAHKTRSLLFLPTKKQDKLLISIGSTCNVCEEPDRRHATVLVFDTTSGKTGYYATGLRNAVFMALHPITKQVYATEMGRDGLGDDTPPDEINIITEGKWYGWPWFYGKNIEDTTFKYKSRPSFTQEPTPSAVDLQAHSAPLGISFIPDTTSWTNEYKLNAVVAYHGSWNRSTLTGYKIVRIIFDTQGNYVKTEDFITGWLTENKKTLGRPAGILALPNGELYITDDQSGKVFLLKSKQEQK